MKQYEEDDKLTELVRMVKEKFPTGCNQKCDDCVLGGDSSLYNNDVCNMLDELTCQI